MLTNTLTKKSTHEFNYKSKDRGNDCKKIRYGFCQRGVAGPR